VSTREHRGVSTPSPTSALAPALRRPARVTPPRSPVLTARRERALVRDALAGDAAAVEALFSAHWPACHRAALLITRDADAAQDIAQEAFLAALAALHRFDRRRPLGPWLRTIVARRAIDHSRARTARREVDGAALASAAAPQPTSLRPSDELLAAIAELPADQRSVVVLRHLLELTPREVATTLDLPVGTVNSRMRRALDALRAALDAEAGS
jgi:RNA polymerase sigma-70 factor (ECF subfamily)